MTTSRPIRSKLTPSASPKLHQASGASALQRYTETSRVRNQETKNAVTRVSADPLDPEEEHTSGGEHLIHGKQQTHGTG
eukprot:1754762-Karenia_brevis.AAC.1